MYEEHNLHNRSFHFLTIHNISVGRHRYCRCCRFPTADPLDSFHCADTCEISNRTKWAHTGSGSGQDLEMFGGRERGAGQDG